MSNVLMTIPLCQLKRSKLNIRKTDKLTDIEQLAASIEAKGLLENLVVRPGGTNEGGEELYEVVAGGRRLAALKLLAKRGKIASDHGIACLVREEDDVHVVETSLAENIVRAPVHPADQFEAFAKLQKQGLGVEDIAARFGIEAKIILQRLKLAAVSPRLIAAYRKGEMGLDQLMAFTVSDDHRTQEEIWFDHPLQYSSPGDIRRLLTSSLVDGSDRRARFVGVKAYEEAGGEVRRDLFQSEAEWYFADSGLLDRLAAQKLQAEAYALKEEGWGWVAVRLETDYAYLGGFRRLPPTEVKLPAKEEKQLKVLCGRYDELVSGMEEEGADGSELDRVTAAINELQAMKETWPEEERLKAGAIISLDPQGYVHITRGLVRPEDDGQGANASDEEAIPKLKKTGNGYSAALMADLSAHRTAALREVLASAPDKALVALLGALVPQVFFALSGDSSIEVRLTSTDLAKYSDSVGEGRAMAQFLTRHKLWQERIPENGKLWDWLAVLEQSEQLALLAHCTALAVNGVVTPGGKRGEAAAALARAVALDMAEWWRPTAANFFDRVSKDVLLAAVSEGASPADAARLRALKKRQVSGAAEKLLGANRWLPEFLKTASSSDEVDGSERGNEEVA